ncbi:MAG: DUF5682 family protein [Bacteroidota bacterium]
MAITILGIRHHGVGSAKNVLEMLRKLQPDLLLVEGPPELDAVTKWIGSPDLKPPASVLCYDEALPARAVFYPFSEFSPEWQAIAYANKHKIPVRMMDLPLAVNWQMKFSEPEAAPEETPEAAPETAQIPIESDQAPVEEIAQIARSGPRDPIGYFASIAGYDSADLWWEHHFEQKYLADSAESHFEAVMLMMQNLREAGIETALDPENEYREAWMARMLRTAQNEMYQQIVVVCGAWHAPALLNLDKTETAHAKILKKLPKPKIKIGTTWIPWTNNRLSFSSGYGAGIHSPGWYGHLWKHPSDLGPRWLAQTARLFRDKKMDISTAHVLEAYRLSESLASLRGLTRPGLMELNEAVTTVMCMGDTVLLELVRTELIVGHALGKVPDDLPKLPLQADFEAQVRKLRLPLTANGKEKELNLREENGLKSSIFLHRLQILGIPWAQPVYKRTKGTFKEAWQLNWSPEMLISIIEMGIWGNTVEAAATQFLLEKSKNSLSVPELSGLISQAIPAELFPAIEALLKNINELATVSSDIVELMTAVLPLADLGRYGNVRKSDMEAVGILIQGLVVRICIGLPNACYGLDEATAQKMFELMRKVNDALRTLADADLLEQWNLALLKITQKDQIPAVISGCCCRLLFDAHQTEHGEIVRQFHYALSVGNDPAYTSGWLEGFLKGSGMILLYDDLLWNLLHQWVSELSEDLFVNALPILRRTFSHFETAERRQLGEKAKRGVALGDRSELTADTSFNHQLGLSVLPLTARLLGLRYDG